MLPPSATPVVERARAAFRAAGGDDPSVVALAPGRVNLIGEHTDYNDGLVLPIAIDAWCAAAASAHPAGRSRVRALDLDQARSLAGCDASGLRLDADGAPIAPGSWCSYVAGTLGGVASWGAPGSSPAIDLLITSTVPRGGGLSSSAALEIAVAIAAHRAWNVPFRGALDLARLCQRAEHEFAGVPCGLMDQCVGVLGQAGHATLLDCRDLSVEQVPMPEDVRVVVVDTGVRHALAGGEYAARRDECRRASAALGVASLRDAAPSAVHRMSDGMLRARAGHVVTEIDRVRRAASALRSGDVEHVGLLMDESHRSLRDSYHVSCPELDRAVDGLRAMGGVLGARMTGGGFGGCAIALVEADAADAVSLEAVARALGVSARVVVASDGAWRLNGLG